jgi:hypothetical protein
LQQLTTVFLGFFKTVQVLKEILAHERQSPAIVLGRVRRKDANFRVREKNQGKGQS